MDDLHTGQAGAAGSNAASGISTIDGDTFRPSLRRSAIPLPSINSIFRPEANSFASRVKVPDVTT
jgi:hypothetical protein